jgi:hypothetical protein
VYEGNPAFELSVSPAFTQDVAALASSTSTSLSSLPIASALGTPVTITATVAAVAGNGRPTGIVSFHSAGQLLGTAPLQFSNGSMRASITTTFPTAGSRFIDAFYSGDTVFAKSGSTLVHSVYSGSAPATTSTSIASSANPSNSVVRLTITVQPSGPKRPVPGVVIIVVDGLMKTGDYNLVFDGKTSKAVITLPFPLTRGGHSIVAYYLGSTAFAASQSPPHYQVVQ